VDAVHVLSDLVTVIDPDGSVSPPGLPARALLMSALRPTAPLALLNASMGDSAVVDRHRCACPLGSLGWVTRLRAIRSFES
jgi:hypothetical protein